jgi:hypothetical protein
MAKISFTPPAKLLSWQGVHVFSRKLRYRNQRVKLADGTEHSDYRPKTSAAGMP